MTILLPYRSVGRAEAYAHMTANGLAIAPSSTWTVPNGTTALQRNPGGRFTQSDNWTLQDSVGGPVRLAVDLSWINEVELAFFQFGISINGSDPTKVERDTGSTLNEYAQASFVVLLDLEAGDTVAVRVRTLDSATATMRVVRAQLRIQELPLSSAADLLSVAQSLGFELFLDMYTEGGYALSGSTIVSLKNRITDTDVSVFGSPQFSATGLNGGPACIFDGLLTRFLGTDVTALARMTDNTPFTLIYVAGWDVPDSSSTMFSVGTPSSSVPFRRFGTSDTGTGRHAATFISDGSAETVQVFDDTNGRLDAPHIVEWDFDGSTITMRLDRQATGVTNVPYTNSGLTPTKWVWGCLSRNNNAQIHDGPGSLLLLGPQLSSGQKDTLYAAIAAHHSALAGLLA